MSRHIQTITADKAIAKNIKTTLRNNHSILSSFDGGKVIEYYNIFKSLNNDLTILWDTIKLAHPNNVITQNHAILKQLIIGDICANGLPRIIYMTIDRLLALAEEANTILEEDKNRLTKRPKFQKLKDHQIAVLRGNKIRYSNMVEELMPVRARFAAICGSGGSGGGSMENAFPYTPADMERILPSVPTQALLRGLPAVPRRQQSSRHDRPASSRMAVGVTTTGRAVAGGLKHRTRKTPVRKTKKISTKKTPAVRKTKKPVRKTKRPAKKSATTRRQISTR